jgi:predicted transcriptional regulator
MLSNIKNEVELLRRHVTILKLVLERAPVGIIKLADLSGLPQHKVRYSLRVLEQKGFIRPSVQGAVSTAKAKRFAAEFKKDMGEIETDIKEILKAFD